MIQSVSLVNPAANSSAIKNIQNVNFKSNSLSTTNSISVQKPNYDAAKLAGAYRGYNNIALASSISFGSSLANVFEEFSKVMVTCEDQEHHKKGEEVGKRADVSKIVSQFKDDLPEYDDAIKTNIEVSKDKDKDGNVTAITDARTQIKKGSGKKMKFEMTVRPPRKPNQKPGLTKEIQQDIKVQIEPYGIELDENNGRHMVGTPENVYILNTKGKLMAVVEDGDNVLLTNTGNLAKKDQTQGYLTVNAFQEKNDYTPFEVKNVPEIRPKTGGSQGGGTDLIIGLEEGRFIPEIIESIEDFQNKIKNGEIVLDEFVPAPNAQAVQIGMLAGGFGSRAEYANASSSKIMHGNPNGSNLTKGCFRTATGLTPMETSFISLHKAGLLDCSKEHFGIGKNIKFYINDSGKNGGNGSFSVDMYKAMARESRKSMLILPNDAMSRIPNALRQINEKISSGDVAMVMVAKQVSQEAAREKLGIMKISDNGIIESFAEKPKNIEPGYSDKNGNCFANTFQFAVSDEAFEVLNELEPYIAKQDGNKKEARDWSKTYTPLLMALTQDKAVNEIKEDIKKATGISIPDDDIINAKGILGNQKIYAIKSDEPWADCGTLNALYDTTMQIASGVFPLEDFERAHVLSSVNTKTGLVASSPEQKSEIEGKYNIEGQIMAVPKAKPTDVNVVERNKDAIVRYSEKF